MSDSSPFYVERKPMKNQGVFTGDGLPFRFAFSVWTGEKIPGGTVGDTSLYYCFQVGDGTSYETPVLPGKQDRCWIKKSVFEAVNTSGVFSGSENLRILKYKSGSIVIFYYGTVVGIIHGGSTSSEMLWNTPVFFASGYVFDDATATYWQDRRTTYFASTRFEFTAPLYRGVFDLENDRVAWIQREHQFVFDDIVDEEIEYCLIPTGDIDGVVQSLHIGVPDLFSIIDQRVGVFNSTSDSVATPNLRLVGSLLGGPGTSDILPTNVDVPPAQTYPLPQYDSFTLDDDTGIIDSGSPVNILSYRNAAYDINILDGIGEGNRLLLYITLAFDEDGETITGTLSHVEGSAPIIPSAAEGTINLALCSVMYENNTYRIYAINSYRNTITGGALELQTPSPTFEDEVGDFIAESFANNPSLEIDLNAPESQADHGTPSEEIAFMARVGQVDPIAGTANAQCYRFFNSRYNADGDLGIKRKATTDEDRPCEVQLTGVDEPPTPPASGSLSPNKVYGFAANGEWGLYELETLFQLDAVNKRFYYNPQKYDTGTQLVLDHSAPTAKFDFEWDSNTYNSVKVRVLTDIRWDSTLNKLIKSYRDITLPKVLVSHVSAETDVDVIQGQECE